jgi:hypothetical protein
MSAGARPCGDRLRHELLETDGLFGKFLNAPDDLGIANDTIPAY